VVARVLALVALAGCYSPEVGDCVDRCEQSGICPDGLSCDTGGFCRVEGATEACMAHDTDAAADGSGSGSDGNPAVCPAAPVQQGCTQASPAPVMPYCYVACNAGSPYSAAAAFSVGTWHVASVTTDDEESAAVTAAAGGTIWIGLLQAMNQATPADGWAWADHATYSYMHWASVPTQQPDDGGGGGEHNIEQCATLSGMGWADEACGNGHAFLISPF
jgi:hypothetical protein